MPVNSEKSNLFPLKFETNFADIMSNGDITPGGFFGVPSMFKRGKFVYV
jgi:hypothetical protein